MAAYHARSNSFPTRQNPLIPEFDKQLSRLRSSHEASSSSASVTSRLTGLEEVYDSLGQLLLLPLNQQALSRGQNEKWVDELLDGSLRILDICNATKDALTQTKESAQELQSTLRRRCSSEMALTSEFKKILASRKVAKNAVKKALEKRCNSSPPNKNPGNVEIVSMLREIESITCAVIESLFSFITGPKSSSWSKVSKLMNSKRVLVEEVNESNEFESAKIALLLLISQKAKKQDSKLEVNAQKQLQKLELCIQVLEEVVESLYRRLIKIRVSLLNILNHIS